jgi:hypothetical protein
MGTPVEQTGCGDHSLLYSESFCRLIPYSRFFIHLIGGIIGLVVGLIGAVIGIVFGGVGLLVGLVCVAAVGILLAPIILLLIIIF